MLEQRADVVVVGAGVAGLAAAAELSRAGRSVLVLEARGRIGGRVASVHDPALPLSVELGAEFIHGTPPEIWDIVRAARLGVYEHGGTRSWVEAGRRTPIDERGAEELFERMERDAGADRSFAAFLESVAQDAQLRTAIPYARAFVEGFDAADTERIGVQALVREQHGTAAVDGDRAFRLLDGYDAVPRLLAGALDPQSCAIKLNTQVSEIHWRRGHVAVVAQTSGGALERFESRCAILTLPLGVLQAPAGAQGAVRFVPEPPAMLAAAQRLAMGQVAKLSFRFHAAFWEQAQLDGTGFLLARDAAIPTWWTPYPLIAPLLIGWAGGPAGQRLVGLDEAAAVDRALDALAHTLGLARGAVEAALEGHYVHSWHADPLARGAYSYVPVGALDAVDALARPVDDTLFVAGEATDTQGQTGTVHGAIATGRRAASQVLARLATG